MKKSILFFVVFILTACASAPQVTVMAPSAITVTLTPPISTPTLHPEFAALQQTIADSGSRFTLGADGLLYDGETPIPGITVTPDGTMTLTVNGETVTLDPADVDFDDEKGISFKGYDFQDTDGDGNPDSWVEVISEAMQQTNKLIETYGLEEQVANGEIIVVEEGGAVNVVKKGVGEEPDRVLIRTIGENSKFDLGFGTDSIAAKSCEVTPFKLTSSGRMMGEYLPAAIKYVEKLREEFNIPFTESGGGIRELILLKREGPCWGFVVNDDLLFRDANHVAQRLPLIPMTDAGLIEFAVSRYSE